MREYTEKRGFGSLQYLYFLGGDLIRMSSAPLELLWPHSDSEPEEMNGYGKYNWKLKIKLEFIISLSV